MIRVQTWNVGRLVVTRVGLLLPDFLVFVLHEIDVLLGNSGFFIGGHISSLRWWLAVFPIAHIISYTSSFVSQAQVHSIIYNPFLNNT
jgi:hypothetical protein